MDVRMNLTVANQQISDYSRLSVSSKSPNNSVDRVDSAADVVNVSLKGRQMLATEIGSQLHASQNQLQSPKQTEESESEKDALTQLIEKLQQQVEKLEQQLQELQGERGEAADKQRQVIQSQITALLAQIAELTKQKTQQAS